MNKKLEYIIYFYLIPSISLLILIYKKKYKTIISLFFLNLLLTFFWLKREGAFWRMSTFNIFLEIIKSFEIFLFFCCIIFSFYWIINIIINFIIKLKNKL